MIAPILDTNAIPIGILFNAFVTTVVAVVASTFASFLFRRWPRLNPTMRAYAWFWVFTTFTWIGITLRYIMIGFGYLDERAHWINEIFLQSSIFISGVPLAIYIALLVFKNKRVAWGMAIAMVVTVATAIWFFLQPNGFLPGKVTFFTADPVISSTPLAIFGVCITIFILLLIYDSVKQIYQWRRQKTGPFPYAILYSFTIIIYSGLGSIDQFKPIVDWPIVVFRICYIAAFLLSYLVVVQDEARREQYLVESA